MTFIDHLSIYISSSVNAFLMGRDQVRLEVVNLVGDSFAHRNFFMKKLAALEGVDEGRDGLHDGLFQRGRVVEAGVDELHENLTRGFVVLVGDRVLLYAFLTTHRDVLGILGVDGRSGLGGFNVPRPRDDIVNNVSLVLYNRGLHNEPFRTRRQLVGFGTIVMSNGNGVAKNGLITRIVGRHVYKWSPEGLIV